MSKFLRIVGMKYVGCWDDEDEICLSNGLDIQRDLLLACVGT